MIGLVDRERVDEALYDDFETVKAREVCMLVMLILKFYSSVQFDLQFDEKKSWSNTVIAQWCSLSEKDPFLGFQLRCCGGSNCKFAYFIAYNLLRVRREANEKAIASLASLDN